MKKITYLESCNRWFAPVELINEALANHEGVNGLSYKELQMLVSSNSDLLFYCKNFDEYVTI